MANLEIRVRTNTSLLLAKHFNLCGSFFLTNQNERYLNPNFGSNLRSKLFEQIEQQNINGLQQNIQDLISRYFSNINVEKLDITPSYDTNELFTSITYSIIDTGIVDNIQIGFAV